MISLSEEDAKWLRALNERVWRRSVDRFGGRHMFEQGVMPAEDVARVLALIEKHELPCVLHSGCYGQLSMSVYAHSDMPQVEPQYLFTLGQDHLTWEDQSFKGWNARFEYFAKYTHSARNRELCKFYGLPEPQAKGRYEY